MDAGLALGVGAAVAASILFDVGVALQALEARAAPVEQSLRPSLLGRLVRRRRWLAGSALAVLGYPFHLTALLIAPLTVVQPALASGLLLLLVLGDRMLGERVGAREVGAVVAIVVGVAGIAWAAPEHVTSHAGAAGLAPPLGALALAALAPYLLARRSRLAGGVAIALSAGCAYAFTGLTSKLVADFLSSGAVVAMALWFALTAAIAAVGLLSEMSALQARPATQVAPIVFVVQITVPVLLAPLVSGESWEGTPLGGAGVVVFLGMVAAGAALLAAAPGVGGLVAAGAHGTPKPSPAAPEADEAIAG